MFDWIIVWLVVFAGVYLFQFMINFYMDDDDTTNQEIHPHQLSPHPGRDEQQPPTEKHPHLEQ